MRKLLWNLCSWQLSVETFQKATWYLWKGQNAADVLQLCCPGKWDEGKVWHGDAGAPGVLWSWIMWYFLLMQCVCRYVGDVWWLRELAWAWKALQIHQCPSKRRLSSWYAVVLTVEPLCRQSASSSALRIQEVIWLWSTWKFCIFGLPPSWRMVSSNISCSVFVAHISGPQLAGLGVFANFSVPIFCLETEEVFFLCYF